MTDRRPALPRDLYPTGQAQARAQVAARPSPGQGCCAAYNPGMTLKRRVARVGGSLGVVIPRDLAEAYQSSVVGGQVSEGRIVEGEAVTSSCAVRVT
jgi:hypothetical protein